MSKYSKNGENLKIIRNCLKGGYYDHNIFLLSKVFPNAKIIPKYKKQIRFIKKIDILKQLIIIEWKCINGIRLIGNIPDNIFPCKKWFNLFKMNTLNNILNIIVVDRRFSSGAILVSCIQAALL